MTIDFTIPNGSMKINEDIFFKQATRMQIRKMLKCFKDSDPDPEVVQDLKDWLQRKIQNLKKSGRTPRRNMGSTIKLAERYEGVLEIIEKIGL